MFKKVCGTFLAEPEQSAKTKPQRRQLCIKLEEIGLLSPGRSSLIVAPDAPESYPEARTNFTGACKSNQLSYLSSSPLGSTLKRTGLRHLIAEGDEGETSGPAGGGLHFQLHLCQAPPEQPNPLD